MTDATDIVLVGASVRSLAESALADGLNPWCVDVFADADLRQQVGSDRLFRFKDTAQLPAILADLPKAAPVLIGGGFENQAGLISELQNRGHRLLLDRRTIRSVRDPRRVYPALRSAGVQVPDWSVRAIPGGSHWLLKNWCSSGGLNVQKTSETGWPQTLSPSQYWQQQVDGPIVSASFLSRLDGPDTKVHLLGMALQLSGWKELHAPGFAYCGNVGPILVSEPLQQQMEWTAAAVVSHCAMSGVFGIDFIVSGDRAFAIEINPRVTASHELHEDAARPAVGHVRMQAGTTPELTGTPVAGPDPWIRLILYNDRPREITESASRTLFEGWHPVHRHRMVERLADLPCAGQQLPAGVPLCSAYAKMSTLNELRYGGPGPAWLPQLRLLLPQYGWPTGLAIVADRVQTQMTLVQGDCEIRKS